MDRYLTGLASFCFRVETHLISILSTNSQHTNFLLNTNIIHYKHQNLLPTMKISTASISALTLLLSTSVAALNFSNATTSTDVVYVSDIGTTIVTITSCEEHRCSLSAVTTGITTITKTYEDITTQYTTFCPLTSTSSNIIPSSPVPVPTSSEEVTGSVSITAPPESSGSIILPTGTLVSSHTGNISLNTTYSSISEGNGAKKVASLSSILVLAGFFLF